MIVSPKSKGTYDEYSICCCAWYCFYYFYCQCRTMTEDQIKMLRNLIKDEIECAQIDGMEHGQWGWAEKQLDEGWKQFQESFND